MDLTKKTVKQLRELGAELGLTLPEKATKDELLEILEAEMPTEPETMEEADQMETDRNLPEPEDTEADMEDLEPEALEPEQKGYMAYVGPSIPGGLLPHGKILYGTKTTIGAYLEPVLEKFPEAEALMVPMCQLETAMRDVKNPDKLLYHKAQALKIKAKRNGG